jgi:flagellar biosynthesis protein FliQ
MTEVPESRRGMKVRIRPSANLMRWFTPGLHVKRWLLLLFVAVVMISLAAGYLLRDLYSASIEFPPWVQDATLQFLPRLIRALFFALVGVGLIVLAFYKLSQSILGPFLPGRGSTDRGLAEQLYKFRSLAKGPRLVAIGGGTGLSALLRGVKKYTGNIVAIVTVADDGGSSGRLREEYRVLPPGARRDRATHDRTLPVPVRRRGCTFGALLRESLHHRDGGDHRRFRARHP